MRDKFPYIFQTETFFKNKKILGGGIPKLNLKVVSRTQEIEGLEFTFFELPHGHTKTLAVISNNFAYVVDCATIPKKIVSFLKEQKLDLLIIDCLRTKAHDTHLNLEKSLEYIKEIKPKRAALTHMSHEFDYQQFSKELKKLRELKEFEDIDIFPLHDEQILSL